MIYGYVRVSTEEQGASGLGLEAQENALRAWANMTGADITIVSEVGSGGRDLPELASVLERIGTGDVLAVAKLDRLARSTTRVLAVADRLQRTGADLVALDLAIDTTTPAGRLVLTVLAAISEWERGIISERTKAALAVKSARGELARPDRRTDPAAIARAVQLRQGGATYDQIGQALEQEGFETPQGGQWRRGTVHYLLGKERRA